MDERIYSALATLTEKDAAPKPVNWKGRALGAAGLGALGYAGIRGMRDAGEQTTRTQDLMNARRMDLSAPLPSMSVTASYDDFAEKKLAAAAPNVMSPMMNQGSFILGNTLAQKLVGEPIDAAHRAIKKKFYEEPERRKAFNAAIKDPDIAKALAEHPEHVHSTYATLKKFGPALAADPNAVKSFLRQGIMSGGQIDYATIRSLAETEKFIQASRGKVPG